ncbi:unnamed protein product [Malus baccata var. baccata]
MGMQLMRTSRFHHHLLHPESTSTPPTKALFGLGHVNSRSIVNIKRRNQIYGIVASSNLASTLWDSWKPEKGSAPPLSDITWPSADISTKGMSMTIAPLGAVSAVLFATPSSPGARKYNIFMAQIGCAAIGVLTFSTFGPGWLARSVALAASVAFMICTRSTHLPAASLPLLFIDGAKFHNLSFWYALFPGTAECVLLCLIQEIVLYLKENFKF